ncbi:sugar transferase [candidate division KSB1 bacterium]|nr:sugar transferase [candidate division KSB1 bacterium]
MKRIGYLGRPFTLYKLRTMHPYSEFIQDYVYRHNNLDPNGKFKDDFRITTWGRLFRRCWIDELPQLINYLRGDVQIFGVRALSEHYFSLYPDDVKEMRIRFKPGLVPPYYADMPKNLNEIIVSERRYLHKKLAHPLRTDWNYFWRAVYNIVFRHARSG